MHLRFLFVLCALLKQPNNYLRSFQIQVLMFFFFSCASVAFISRDSSVSFLFGTYSFTLRRDVFQEPCNLNFKLVTFHRCKLCHFCFPWDLVLLFPKTTLRKTLVLKLSWRLSRRKKRVCVYRLIL